MHQENTSKYSFIKTIGEGGNGVVFKARCNTTQTTVAIKYIRFADGECIEFIRSVAREVKILIHLSHRATNKYTIKLLDIFLPEECDIDEPTSLSGIYMVTDYFPVDLFDVICSDSVNFTKSHALLLSYNILKSVNYLHKNNILHRDLKPQNILVTKDFEVRICDFGLSRGIRSLTPNKPVRKMSLLSFTRFYRPPE